MGWTGLKKPANVKEFLKQEFTDSTCTVIDSAIVNVKEAYLALKHEQTGEVFALVVLLEYNGDELLYKDMSEDMEPYYYNCPAKILNKLTPRESEYANRWREKCRKIADKKSTVKNLQTGDVIKLAEPLRFQGGAVLDTFQVYKQGRTMVLVNGYNRYRIPNLARYDFEVIKSGHGLVTA